MSIKTYVRAIGGPVCVLGSALSVYVLLHRQNERLQEQLLEASRRQIAQIAAPTTTVERIIVREPDLTPSAAGQPVLTSPPQTPAPIATRIPDQAPRTVDEIKELVGSRFDADRPDRSPAAGDAFRTISAAISERQPDGVKMQSLDCREHMCKVELEFRDSDADRSVMNSLFRGDSQIRMGGVMVPSRETSPDGRVTATVYIAREGDISLD